MVLTLSVSNPQTQDSLKTEENMKRELRVRLAMAGFLKDTLTEITNKKVRPVRLSVTARGGRRCVYIYVVYMPTHRAGHMTRTHVVYH